MFWDTTAGEGLSGRGERGERREGRGQRRCHRSQRLLAGNGTSKKHILPMEEVNQAAVYGPQLPSHKGEQRSRKNISVSHIPELFVDRDGTTHTLQSKNNALLLTC